MSSISKSERQLKDAEIAVFEDECNFELPYEYRAFLGKFNGGVPERQTFRFLKDGSTAGSFVKAFFPLGCQPKDLRYWITITRGRLPDNLLPIAREAGGNLICISASGDDVGKLYVWDTSVEPRYDEGEECVLYPVLAKGFADFVSKLV